MKSSSIFLENRLTATERAWLKKIFWLNEALAFSTIIWIDNVVVYVLHMIASIFVMLTKWLRVDASVTFSHSR